MFKPVSKLLLLALWSSAHAARPWSVTFGSCAFSGDFDGAPLVRSGSCPTRDGWLNLDRKGNEDLIVDEMECVDKIHLQVWGGERRTVTVLRSRCHTL